MYVTRPAVIVFICYFFRLVDLQQVKPSIDTKIESKTVEIGETVELDCAALNPKAPNNSVIYWTKLTSEPYASLAIISANSILVSENERITLSCSLDGRKCALRIQDVTDSDAGTYKCSILREDHSSGSKSSKVRLSVHNPYSSTAPPSSSPPPSTSASSNLSPYPNPTPPVIYNVSPDLIVNENETVSLECHASGAPPPLISWRRNEVVIYRGAVLQIHAIRKENRGAYDCVAESFFGSDRKSVAIAVEFTPIVRANVPRVYQVEGNDVDLRCRVEGFPLPDIEWSKNGAKISSDAHYSISERPYVDRFVSSTLHVKSVESKDFGTYVCKAVNERGEAKANIVLSTVKDAGSER